MAWLSIPLKVWSGASAVAYDTAVDGSYNIYNATLKNYPVANAFVDGSDTSQEKWWLQITSRATQNNAWKTQLSYGVSSGTGNVSTKSITYPFTSTIKQIDSATIAYGIYQRASTLTFNETTNKITNVKGIASFSGILTSWYQNKSYVASAGWNKFVAIGDSTNIKVYPISATGDITSATPTDTKTISYTPVYSGQAPRYHIVAAKGAYVWAWVYYTDVSWGNGIHYYKAQFQLYSINSSGVLTAVGTSVAATLGSVSNLNGYNPWYGVWSYITNNTAHSIFLGSSNDTLNQYFSRCNEYRTIDLSNTTIFTSTQIRSETTFANGAWQYVGWIPQQYSWSINVGYNGSDAITIDRLNNIYTVNGTAFTDSGSDSLCWVTDICQYRQSVALLSADTNQVRTTSTNKFKIKWSDTNGSLTNLTTKCLWMYEMTGTNNESQQSALLAVYLDSGATWSGSLILKANWTTINTIFADNCINPAPGTIALSNIAINTNKILFELLFTNPEAIDTKIGFWLTGGTYASPTGNYETSTVNLTLG